MKALILAGVASVALIGAAAAQDNYLRSQQTGIDNDIDALQSGSNNAAGIRGSATNNLRQTGDGNALKITQSGDNNTIGGTRPFVFVNLSASRQTGNNNSLEINQSGDNNTTKYIQNGNNNGQQSGGVASGTSGAPGLGRSYTSPSGRWNYVEQTGDNLAGAGSTVDILQNVPLTTGGVGNGVIARQSAASSTISLSQQSGSASNLANFEQAGSNNTASVTQVNNGAAKRNLSDIRQSGNNSQASASQSGNGLDLFVTQTGGNNASTTSQTLSADSYIQVTQDHDGGIGTNRVNATQILATSSGLLVSQTGYGQQATSFQQGNFITASVEQTGFGNTYSGFQSGSTNSATVTQASNSNLANVLQTGTNSAVTIRQR